MLSNEEIEVLLNGYRERNSEFIGKRYGRLVIEDVDINKMIEVKKMKNKYIIYFKCICDCGNHKTALKSSINRGNTTSCGCFRRETTAEFNKKTKTKDYREYLDDGTEVKRCSKCNEVLSIDNFYVQKSGLSLSWCKKCNYERRANIVVKCNNCTKEFKTTKQQLDKNDSNFCGMSCRNEYYSKTRIGVSFITDDGRRRISEKHKERYSNKMNHPMFGKKHSLETRLKLSQASKLNAKRGSDHYNYKHDLTDEERGDKRLIPKYQEWRSSVFARDNYSCRLCGKKSTGDIVAHHLDGYNWCKEKRTDVDNGITLCKNCHNAFHKKYGNGNNTKDQWEVFCNEFKRISV